MSHITKDQIVNEISNMSALDIMELIRLIENKFNISLEKEKQLSSNHVKSNNENNTVKTEFNIILKSIGKNKIAVIRTIRNILGIGLKEAKDFVESAPKLIKENINKEEINKIEHLLIDAGAEIEIN